MEALLRTFLQEGSRESFLALRTAHLSQENLDPYSTELDGAHALLGAEDYQRAHDLIAKHMVPNHFMSSGTHMTLAFALHKLGDEERAEFEGFLGTRLLEGIESTGDGTEKNPYLVTRTSDEYDLLSARELELEQQSLVERKGRQLDRMQTTSGETLWFDITEVMAIMQRNCSP